MPEHKGYKVQKFDDPLKLRVHDLKEWHVLEITCYQCGHQSVVYPAVLRRHFTIHEWISNCDHKFRCSACGNKRLNSWEVGKLNR